MIKKLTYIFILFSSGFLTAQNLELRDNNNTSIEGQTFYFYDTPSNLSVTSLYVGNLSGSAITFDAVMKKVTNPTGNDWQVCYGSQCYIAQDAISTNQYFSDPGGVVPATGFYSDFKPAPFSFSWNTGDWGKWYVSVINSVNSADSSGACVIWTAGGTFAGDINSNKMVDAGEFAGDIDLNGTIDGSEILGDMDGSGTIDVCEVHGDKNGNGIIDGTEVALSIDELEANKVKISMYPNPVSNVLTIKYDINSSSSDRAEIEVFDVVGKKMKTYSLKKDKGQLNVDVSNLNAGVYFYAITVNGQSIKTERVIIK